MSWSWIQRPNWRKRQKCTFRLCVPHRADGQSDPSSSIELVKLKVLRWGACNFRLPRRDRRLIGESSVLSHWAWRVGGEGLGPRAEDFRYNSREVSQHCYLNVQAWRISNDLFRGMDVIKVDNKCSCTHFALFAEGFHRSSKVIRPIGPEPPIKSLKRARLLFNWVIRRAFILIGSICSAAGLIAALTSSKEEVD